MHSFLSLVAWESSYPWVTNNPSSPHVQRGIVLCPPMALVGEHLCTQPKVCSFWQSGSIRSSPGQVRSLTNLLHCFLVETNRPSCNFWPAKYPLGSNRTLGSARENLSEPIHCFPTWIRLCHLERLEATAFGFPAFVGNQSSYIYIWSGPPPWST